MTELSVIVCPLCKIHFMYVVEKDQKTTMCPSCQRRVELHGLKSLYRGQDSVEARNVVSSLRTMAANPNPGEIEEIRMASSRSSSSSEGIANEFHRVPSSDRKRLPEIILGILDEEQNRKGINDDDLKRLLTQRGFSPADVEDSMKKLILAGEMFNPRPGRWGRVR